MRTGRRVIIDSAALAPYSPQAVLTSRRRLFPAAADVPRNLGIFRLGRFDGVPGDQQPHQNELMRGLYLCAAAAAAI